MTSDEYLKIKSVITGSFPAGLKPLTREMQQFLRGFWYYIFKNYPEFPPPDEIEPFDGEGHVGRKNSTLLTFTWLPGTLVSAPSGIAITPYRFYRNDEKSWIRAVEWEQDGLQGGSSCAFVFDYELLQTILKPYGDTSTSELDEDAGFMLLLYAS